LDTQAILRAYRRYARVYDLLFGAIFHPGREFIIRSLGARSGERILEVGVGTGLSLPLYPEHVKVTGIDISKHMLDIARKRVERMALQQVEGVMEMDAQNMSFRDSSFDKVVAMYVVSVVPDPIALIDEIRRVCKPGGDIYIVNHFRARNPLLAMAESLLSPISKLVGFRPDLDLDRFLEESGLDLVETHNVNLFGYWKLLRCRNREAVAFNPSEPAEQSP